MMPEQPSNAEPEQASPEEDQEMAIPGEVAAGQPAAADLGAEERKRKREEEEELRRT